MNLILLNHWSRFELKLETRKFGKAQFIIMLDILGGQTLGKKIGPILFFNDLKKTSKKIVKNIILGSYKCSKK